ncbi:MAG: hypothetical protein PHS44_04810 [Candidatus Dojkabacteria bacterium]|jgi:hypothetical protein|nr:hypothetical protein [Candidatus Dojkabacteria bacterium]
MNRAQAKIAFITMVAVILLGVVGFAAFMTFRGNKKTPGSSLTPIYGTLPSPIDENFENSIKLDYSDFTQENTSSSGKVYEIDQYNPLFPSKMLSQKVADNLDLKAGISDAGVIIYSHINKQEYIKLDTNSNSITVHLGEAFQSSTKYLLKEEKAVVIAKSKLESLGLWPYSDDYDVSFQYYYIIGMSYYPADDSKDASLIEVDFTSKREGLPLNSSDSKSGEVSVMINLNDDVTKIFYAYRPVDPDEYGIYPLISTEEATARVTQKKAELVIPFEGETPSIITVDKFEIVYRIQYESQKYLQPVYLIEGEDNNNQTVTLLVPAISDDYLNQ